MTTSYDFPSGCAGCTVHLTSDLSKQGLEIENWDYMVALAGNPNTGKSSVFNALTGLRQHTGNWPGKTVARAEGGFEQRGNRFKLVDLPGTYSLLSTSEEERVARDFLLAGRPDVTVVVVDAGRLERNLALALQVLAVTDRVVICLNLMDEADRHRIAIDARRLARDLGVPVVPTSARQVLGLDELVRTIGAVAAGEIVCRPRRTYGLAAVLAGDLHQRMDDSSHERLLTGIYDEASRIAERAVTHPERKPRFDFDRAIDQVVTSRIWGFPLMFLMLGVVIWITVSLANIPSSLLSTLLIGRLHPLLKEVAASIGLVWWIDGLLIDGVYLATAWVVSVMLPPMAIFFPLFTLLEDFGYLPRVAFNLDRAFKRVGAHGKQSLTMAMGFGCNAAGVISTRIIDSPREKLVAIITNNFALCNGRWPTQILIATIFIGALVPAHLAGMFSALAVVGIALLGVLLTLGVSGMLTRSVLKGEDSAFSLELPPYRPPRVLQTLCTSMIDRTLHVLWRAMVFAAPAGAVIWLISNVTIGHASVAEHMINLLDPFGLLLGLNGVILVAYMVAIPANEIVIPTILMLTLLVSGAGDGAGVMLELDSLAETVVILKAGGWTLLTAVSVMLFSLVHNPCSTTIYTAFKETGSKRWTAVTALLPLFMGFAITFLVAQMWRLTAG